MNGARSCAKEWEVLYSVSVGSPPGGTRALPSKCAVPTDASTNQRSGIFVLLSQNRHYTQNPPDSDTSLCPIRGVSPRLSARSSSSYYTISDRKKSRTPVRPFPLDGCNPHRQADRRKHSVG